MVPQRAITHREEFERRPDPDADVHEETVARLQAARVRRELTQLPALEQLVLCWRFGVARRPVLSRREIAGRLGYSLRETRRLEERALAQLRGQRELIDEVA
jgi:DNA-directed RNA polymerase specialized sigma subunit